MKSEPKAFASLSSGLLARKGAARPAMRPQGFGQATGNLEDLGWNDMGVEPHKPSSTPLREVHAAEEQMAARMPFAGLTPVESPVHSQQAEIADRLMSAEEADDFEDNVEVSTGQDLVEPVLDPEASVDEPMVLAPPPAVEAVVAMPEPLIAAVPAPEPVRDLAVRETPVVQTPRRMAKPRSAAGSNGKAAFTLRLDPHRHLKLRLACAVGGRSAQQIVTDALDQLLASMPELDAMAEKAQRKGS